MRYRLLLLSAGLSLTAGAALPENAPGAGERADPQQVARLYAGKTDLWGGDCGGGIYFSPEMQARAWCRASPDAFGAGSWSVDAQGRICHTLTWYWADGGGAPESGEPETSCVEHAEDSRGRIWRRWPGDPDWWRMQNSALPVQGYKFRRQVSAARKATGF